MTLHKVTVEIMILTRSEPDDAGFDMFHATDGEVARMRSRSEELSEEEGVRQAIEMGMNHEKLLRRWG